MTDKPKPKLIAREVTEKQDNLLNTGETILYGRTVVFWEHGQPVRIEEIIKSIKL